MLFIFRWALGKNCDLIHAESSRRRLSCFDSILRIFLHTYCDLSACYDGMLVGVAHSRSLSLTKLTLSSRYIFNIGCIEWQLSGESVIHYQDSFRTNPACHHSGILEIFNQRGIFPCHQNFRSKEDKEKFGRICKLNLHIYGLEKKVSIHCLIALNPMKQAPSSLHKTWLNAYHDVVTI